MGVPSSYLRGWALPSITVWTAGNSLLMYIASTLRAGHVTTATARAYEYFNVGNEQLHYLHISSTYNLSRSGLFMFQSLLLMLHSKMALLDLQCSRQMA